MLKILVKGTEIFNNETCTFYTTKDQTLQLEHSLVSIAKWESKWHKPFLIKEEKTNEEIIDYIRCMTLTQNVDPNVYASLSAENIKQIEEYIDDSMTATWFSNQDNKKKNREIITAEIIYYWMIALNIPPEYQKWHLNRLLTLIEVCNIKNQPPKKMKRKDLINRNKSLNEARRKALNSEG